MIFGYNLLTYEANTSKQIPGKGFSYFHFNVVAVVCVCVVFKIYDIILSRTSFLSHHECGVVVDRRRVCLTYFSPNEKFYSLLCKCKLDLRRKRETQFDSTRLDSDD